MVSLRAWCGRACEKILAISLAYGALAPAAGPLVSREAAAAPAATPDDDFDDPKLARELAAARAPVAPTPKTAPASPPPKAAPPAARPTPAPAPAPVNAATTPAPIVTRAAPAPAAPMQAAAPPASAAPAPAPSVAPHAPFLIAPPLPSPEPGSPSGSAPTTTVTAPPPSVASPADHAPPHAEPVGSDIAVKTAGTEPDPSTKAAGGEASGRWSYAPRAKLAYRRFGFSRMPVAETSATGVTTTGAPADEAFESLSLDLYPMSSYMRIGFSSQFGWESGQFQRTGDYFIAESATLGIQWPGRFTPFAEALAGGGYMRRKQGTADKPSAYWQLGIDAGVEIYFANRAYGSLALGYLRPGNLFYADKTLGSVKLDTWSLKVGIGI